MIWRVPILCYLFLFLLKALLCPLVAGESYVRPVEGSVLVLQTCSWSSKLRRTLTLSQAMDKSLRSCTDISYCFFNGSGVLILWCYGSGFIHNKQVLNLLHSDQELTLFAHPSFKEVLWTSFLVAFKEGFNSISLISIVGLNFLKSSHCVS